MSVKQALQNRHSIRAYQSTPVDQALIKQIFTDAQLSASNCNTQPWHVSIISGKARDQLEAALLQHITSGKPMSPAFKPGDLDLKGAYRQRQISCAIALYDTMNIKREDKVKRQQLMLQNWQFFGAPHVAIFSMPKSMGEVNAVDVGIYLQSIMLLMTEAKLACCPQGALGYYPEPIMEITNTPEENGILCGLSFGYANRQAKINETRTEREDVSSCVNFF